LQIQPDYTIADVAPIFSPFKHPADAEHLYQGLRKAGLPSPLPFSVKGAVA